MFLEKLEILGFKSFANKNVLLFPGMLDKSRRGITAVVGPNGSGKSNVADSVRWALGEQSMKTLRGKKSEDIIFSGSDKKGKLGMAEVSLFLNNEDRQAPIDYSEVVITRRLYRNGDSEYMLNNNRVRLSDIQMLLAKASFGQKTYSVIGQGMVEGFLNTTLAERKEFFDEATGVRQYQIKRDESLNKLRLSYENLAQAQMLVSEIEPRLKSLTRQVGRLKKRGEAEKELKEVQLRYYRRVWHDINGKFSDYNSRFLELEKIKLGKDKKLSGLNGDLEKIKTESAPREAFARLETDLNGEQAKKDELNKKLARLDVQTEMRLEAGGQFDLSYLITKQGEIKKELSALETEIRSLENLIAPDRARGAELEGEKNRIDREIKNLNDQLIKAGERAENDNKLLSSRGLKEIMEKISAIEAETDINNIKKLLAAVKNDIKNILASSGALELSETPAENSFKNIHDSLNTLSGQKEEILKKIGENSLGISARAERIKLLTEKKKGLAYELGGIENKIKQSSGGLDLKEVEKEKGALENELAGIEENIRKIKEEIAAVNAAEEQKRKRLFSLQNELSNLQNEINGLNNQLNDYKINSTRYETKLEGLEIEIREELGGMGEIKNSRPEAGETGDLNEDHEKIKQLKRQLELIGGIDPQVENEYTETKERYDFLSGQINDLMGAIDSLQKIIKELDITIKAKFDKEFKLIAEKFQEYFKILFNGGQAKIIKVIEEEKDEEEKSEKEEGEEGEEGRTESKKEVKPDIVDLKKIKFLQKHNATGLAGIEIQATPPGKKIQSVTMLSGGERALTAIALICAIISANPSPFVVLDEVDAALDEANSERLARILDDLSNKTQFIVITHNRASMRRANILYGITMGDDGVSRLLSIKLEDAKNVVEKYAR